MRVLGASVLTMEAIVIGFALLIAKDLSASTSFPAGLVGGLIALLAITAAGLLKRRIGWWLGWLVQAATFTLGIAVPMMYVLGVIFAGLWVGAIVVGRKGEAARARWQSQIDSSHHE